MIASKCFERQWIGRARSDIGKVDPGLLEKCIYALELLGLLKEKDLFEFVFKGGTSLILLLSTFRRLSIDIDVMSAVDIGEYEPAFAEIGRTPPFDGYEEDERGKDRLPRRRHFKFFYQSAVSGIRDYVLLDILEEENIFPQTQLLPVTTTFIEVEQDCSVLVPTVDCLAADKLTAFAPATVGIPLTDQFSMQVAKQVFDIGELFNAVENLQTVKEAYNAIFTAENGYRGNKFTLEQALQDTIETASFICQSNIRGGTIQNEIYPCGGS